MAQVALRVNGKAVEADVMDRTLLVDFLRDNLKLTGTHVGCDTSQCGACVVHVNGDSVKSCAVFVAQINGCDVDTIEGMADEKVEGEKVELSPLQKSFKEHHALQCGFCTPGMIMSAADLLKKKPNPSQIEICKWLEGNLCRCTGYQNIIKAIEAVGKTSA